MASIENTVTINRSADQTSKLCTVIRGRENVIFITSKKKADSIDIMYSHKREGECHIH